jgi:hypothetical protein
MRNLDPMTVIPLHESAIRFGGRPARQAGWHDRIERIRER